ncbi:unnamed protein product, partial [Rotaria sp. Silwood1]
ILISFFNLLDLYWCQDPYARQSAANLQDQLRQLRMRRESIRSDEEKFTKRLQLMKNHRRKHSEKTIENPTLISIGNSRIIMILSPIDRIRLNNIIHCYDQFSGEPSSSTYCPPSTVLCLRIDEFFNRKKPIFINFISYFKHLPELQTLNVDDQVSLIKQNIRLLIPLNYALLKTHINSKFRETPRIQTIGCINNVNLHEMFRSLSNSFVDFVTYDPVIVKLLVVILFFTANPLTTRSIYDPVQFKQLNNIKQIQSSYTELLWLYMLEKYGEQNAIILFTKMITKYLYLQIVIDGIDSIIRMNNDIDNIDSLMQSFLQLT